MSRASNKKLGLRLVAFCCFLLLLAFEALLLSQPSISAKSPKMAPCSIREPKETAHWFGDVETFVMFTGHARSGHSIVGAMLDAHPHMVVAHEYNIPSHWEELNWLTQECRLPLKNILFNQLIEKSCYALKKGNRRIRGQDTNRYGYHVAGQWQGRFKEKIKVIGDKKGTCSAKTMLNDPEFFKRLQGVVGVPVRFIHVVRNPFDNIATVVLRELNSRFDTGNTPINATQLLDTKMRRFIELEEGSARIRQQYPVLDVPSHHVVLKTKETLRKICKFLQVECAADYLDACASIVQEKVSVTRNLVVWTDDQKRWLLKEMQKYPWLRKFTFEDFSDKQR